MLYLQEQFFQFFICQALSLQPQNMFGQAGNGRGGKDLVQSQINPKCLPDAREQLHRQK